VVTLQRGAKLIEERRLARSGRLVFEPLQDTLQQGQRPLTFGPSFGSHLVRRLMAVAALGVETVDWYDGSTLAAFRGSIMIAAIGQVVLACGPEERAKPTLRPIDVCQITSLQEVGEEALDEILGLVR
jgi:hypothetical protein